MQDTVVEALSEVADDLQTASVLYVLQSKLFHGGKKEVQQACMDAIAKLEHIRATLENEG